MISERAARPRRATIRHISPSANQYGGGMLRRLFQGEVSSIDFDRPLGDRQSQSGSRFSGASLSPKSGGVIASYRVAEADFERFGSFDDDDGLFCAVLFTVSCHWRSGIGSHAGAGLAASGVRAHLGVLRTQSFRVKHLRCMPAGCPQPCQQNVWISTAGDGG